MAQGDNYLASAIQEARTKVRLRAVAMKSVLDEQTAMGEDRKLAFKCDKFEAARLAVTALIESVDAGENGCEAQE